MAIDQNGPDAPYPGPAENTPDTGAAHGSGLEQSESEPKQGVGESWSEKRPVDWDPPPGNPGSDQDSQLERDNGSARTKDEQSAGAEGEVPLPSDDDGPIEEEMKDVEANNSVSAEHPQSR
ncbi:hypothetical protein HP546_30460 [Pseudomonas sp. CM25]|uniref:hypothetical protein n=1 Tax=unclassified Pseudomonas TaxID=196821 RepID=UPI001556FBCF|nr:MULTISPECIES: hypothetical protein [unclassified Pseudomonas]NQD59658.1 hypothetical protein [Pseudomonas sp. CM25]NQD77257.1 hypothetical protein [Pseudomonas sp. CM27]